MRIALIGAGLSGLILALKLKPLAKLTLFEKSRGFGGRLASRHSENGSFDHGVPFFKARTSSFQTFLRPMIEKGVVQAWKGSFVEFERNKKVSHRLWTEEPPHYVGVPGMNAIGKHLAEELKRDESKASQSQTKDFKIDELKTDTLKLKSLSLNELQKDKLKKECDIHLKTKVTAILKSGKKWELWGENNKQLGIFDWVVVATPPEQAFAILPKSFQHYSKLSHIKMQACFSLMLGFNKALPLEFQSAFIRGCDISWISVNSSKPGREGMFSLVALSTNEWANAHLEDDDEEVKKHLLKESQFVLGYDLSQADHLSLHRWRYANIEKQEPQNWSDEKQKLVVCGDWTKQGKVEAAFLSAEETAQSLIQFLKEK